MRNPSRRPRSSLQRHRAMLAHYARRGIGVLFDPIEAGGCLAPGYRHPRQVSAAARAFVLQRDGALCRACGREDTLTIDHYIPWIRGGCSHPHNLQVLCGPCNARKGSS